MRYYIIVNYGSVSPELHGPFLSDENRVRWAKKFRKANPSMNDDLIRLTIPERGAPVVDSFYGYELEEES